jgi:plastocyanin
VGLVIRAILGRHPLSIVALCTVVVLAGCAGGSAAASGSIPTSTVDLPKSYKFAPAAITVAAGVTVTWTNHDDFTHNVTLADGTAPMTMSPGSSVTHTFPAEGLYPYTCSLHPKDMKGTVSVTGS